MSTALDLDLATLVGELEDVPCEHSQHGSQPDQHTDEAASHYIQFRHNECGHMRLYAACPGFVTIVAWARSTGFGTSRCNRCHEVVLVSETMTILGPVNGRSS